MSYDRITFRDARKGVRELDLSDEEADELGGLGPGRGGDNRRLSRRHRARTGCARCGTVRAIVGSARQCIPDARFAADWGEARSGEGSRHEVFAHLLGPAFLVLVVGR